MNSPTERPNLVSDAVDMPQAVRLAAIDLGSNSFHLLVAQYQDDRLQVVARLGEKVQLAAGLDATNCLDDASMERAMACLARFAPLLDGVGAECLRVVGTSALRTARNRRVFIARAEALLGCRVEVIPGHEEARLIYLGAAHALAENGRRLVVDIGGGSTEFIVGERLKPLMLESLDIGCVTHTRRHFADGQLSAARMEQAEADVLARLAPLKASYSELGWDEALGSSGTIKAAASVLAADGGTPGEITRTGLAELRRRLVQCGHLDRVALEGLKPDRARIFPAGVAILGAIFEAFGLTTMRYADGALREGVLHDMLARGLSARR
ncbi:Ppx/GppA family phosphatase [Halomonas sp. MCCC 1A17488]|uniref:Ppx/GppA family phosphatase n=1 Tax=Billgrantia sulfidoxydans TaxID=2733484 RepID=A0ABX7VZG0_9GAMM|nr:Ppx/GppA family phosphatase [Halomonas sp. MCCC 1A17488]MCG3240064.1 Ppx/GppA family phosphatase [Halomonas sp. MCCC 1A17488]QPP50053.1 Ppx/GppA family phosphatase [Halomonas sp. SS10-MC5]QTP53664.1 Ppx/GppA family phosphatase [Halomonas sulfidoxydans]